MTKLSDLLDIKQLGEEIHQGYVRTQTHPDDPRLFVFNYAEKTQFEKRWNDVTRACRGLIVRVEGDGDGEVLARPFPKFFNYGEHPEGSLDLAMPAQVTDKLDGSLGITYLGPDGQLALATRGSFASPQAIEGTRMLREDHLSGGWIPVKGLTYLFEILLPWNRIVLDYGPFRQVVLLGAVNIATGDVHGPDVDRSGRFGFWGPRAEVLPARTLREALALEPRENREGIVVRLLDGTQVKIKQEDYVRLHRIVTGLNERSVYEHLLEHGSIVSLVEELPDEFHEWVTIKAENLFHRHDELKADAVGTYYKIVDDLQLEHGAFAWTRGDFARKAKEHAPLTPWLFRLLDGRDISPAIWKTLRPAGITRGPHSLGGQT